MRASIPARREDVTQNVQPLTVGILTETAVSELTSTPMCARTSREVSHRFKESFPPILEAIHEATVYSGMHAVADRD